MENLKYLPMPREGWEKYWQNGNPNNCMLSPKEGFCKICREQKAFDSRACNVCFRKLVHLSADGSYCKSCKKEEQCRTGHCKICHKRFHGRKNHNCMLTNDIKVGERVYHFECYEDPRGILQVTAYEYGIDRLPMEIMGANIQIRMVNTYRYIRRTISMALDSKSHNAKTMEKYSPEKVLKTWALLYMMPDDNVPCKNIRPLDLIADKESLFSSCETTFKALGKEDAR